MKFTQHVFVESMVDSIRSSNLKANRYGQWIPVRKCSQDQRASTTARIESYTLIVKGALCEIDGSNIVMPFLLISESLGLLLPFWLTMPFVKSYRIYLSR